MAAALFTHETSVMTLYDSRRTTRPGFYPYGQISDRMPKETCAKKKGRYRSFTSQLIHRRMASIFPDVTTVYRVQVKVRSFHHCPICSFQRRFGDSNRTFFVWRPTSRGTLADTHTAEVCRMYTISRDLNEAQKWASGRGQPTPQPAADSGFTHDSYINILL